ncbi:SusD/RagB family nutrient-binding outer membrane lipoprotein [Mucilaginibacter sp.]|uniref:SusD/RagB family nutrient-binding outer membrane lipoprotein n=1 Tax=Mucilaginibacter sp. TaxID=1882438 RepID=UPI0035653BF9
MTKKISIIFCLVILLGSCTKDFQKINIDPNKPSNVPIDYLLGESELMVAGSNDAGAKSWRANIANSACIIQQLASTDAGFYGGNFYTSASNTFTAYFDGAYPNAVKSLVNVINLAKADARNVNMLSMARILKVMDFTKITDLYGDVPYSEAGRAFLDNNFTPKYDAQKDIYLDMLKELDESATALNATAYVPTKADYIYAGDVNKWKRAAYTLMLRLALRLQKVDEPTAKLWAAKAIAGGLITSNDETIAVKYDATGAQLNSNPNSWIFNPSGQNVANVNGALWSKTLIDMMVSRQDPRINIISGIKNGDTTIVKQLGLPNATDANGLSKLPVTTLDNYSRPSVPMIALANSWVYMSYAEAKLLLAEAIERGYVTGSGLAIDAFKDGQLNALKQVSIYGLTPTAPRMANYAAKNPYPAAGTLDDKMKAIHTEIYLLHAATFNHIEAWANWRRTGYPVLTNLTPTGNETNGTIPRRLKYPTSEYGVNPNIKDAISRQGADLFTTRVWWDK